MTFPIPTAWRGLRRIGLLGGSFNPAHPGHRHISLLALKRLKLDQVWWLVSPQNPLKPVAGMAPLADRLASARQAARHPRIRATDIETRLGTRYTADTLPRLKQRFPRARFVWLMGADNLIQISKWDRWTTIYRAVPIAVFDRPGYSLRALASVAAKRFGACRRHPFDAGRLAEARPPAWVFVRAARHPASATMIRKRRASARRLLERAKAGAGDGGRSSQQRSLEP